MWGHSSRIALGAVAFLAATTDCQNWGCCALWAVLGRYSSLESANGANRSEKLGCGYFDHRPTE